MDFGGWVDDGFDEFESEMEDWIDDLDHFFVTFIGDGIEGGFIDFNGKLGEGWDDFLDWGEDFGEDFVDVFEDDIPSFAESGINGIEDYFDDAGHWIVDAAGEVGGTAEDLIDELGDFAVEVENAIVEVINEVEDFGEDMIVHLKELTM